VQRNCHLSTARDLKTNTILAKYISFSIITDNKNVRNDIYLGEEGILRVHGIIIFIISFANDAHIGLIVLKQ